MDEIITKLSELIDNRLEGFFNHASASLGVDKNRLITLWKETVIVTNDKPVKSKKSHYQLFFSSKRLELKNKDNSLNFGQLSKQISQLWNSMSKQEQNDWVNTNHKIPEEEVEKKIESKLSDLRSTKGLKKTGTKTELINTLTNSKLAVVKASTTDVPVHISENVGERRSLIEETKAEDSQEEDEFIFDDDDVDNDDDEVSSENNDFDDDGDDES